MNDSYQRMLFVALFAVVLFQTGAHISQSFVNYPAWGLIDRSSFPAYHRVMAAGAFLFLLVPRGVEIVLAIVVLRFRSGAIERWLLVAGIGLALGALLCTAFVQRPIHARLETIGNTPELLARLRTTDWIRLVLEVLRTALYLWMLSLVVDSRTGGATVLAQCSKQSPVADRQVARTTIRTPDAHFEKPDDSNYEPPKHPLLGVDRHFRIAGELQRTFPDLPIVGTGYSWLQKYAINAGARNLAERNIRFVGIGRGALAYPDFAADAMEKGELDERRVCKTLTFCTFLMRQKNHPLGQFPTGCPPFDKEGYGEIMKEARAAQRSGD